MILVLWYTYIYIINKFNIYDFNKLYFFVNIFCIIFLTYPYFINWFLNRSVSPCFFFFLSRSYVMRKPVKQSKYKFGRQHSWKNWITRNFRSHNNKITIHMKSRKIEWSRWSSKHTWQKKGNGEAFKGFLGEWPCNSRT